VREIVERIENGLRDNGVWADVYETHDDFGEKVIKIEISWGDWKHEHLRAKWVVEDVLGVSVRKWVEDVTEEDGSDCYSATHTIYLGKAVDWAVELQEVEW